MKICPVCDTENELGAKNCELCGEPLPPAQAAAAPAAPAAPLRKDTMVSTPAVVLDPSDLFGDLLGDEPEPAPAPVAPAAPAPVAPATPVAAAPAAPAPRRRGGFDFDDDAEEELAPTTIPSAPPVTPEDDFEARFQALEEPSEAATPATEEDFEARFRELEAKLKASKAATPAVAPAAPAPVAATPQPIAPTPRPVAPTPRPAQAAPVRAKAAPQKSSGVPAFVTVYQNKKPAHKHEVVNDETLIGRADPTSATFPDLDLSSFDPGQDVSRRHVRILREGGRYFVQSISNAGTQLGRQLLNIGQRVEVTGGEVLILSGKIALKFEVGLPKAAPTKQAKVTVYQNRKPAHTYLVVNDETLIGRADPTSATFPDLDLSSFDPGQDVSRRHVRILREGGRYFLQPMSNAGTQVGRQLINIGQRAELSGGEVLILAGKIALKFEID